VLKDLSQSKCFEYFFYEKETGFLFRIKHLRRDSYFKKINENPEGYSVSRVDGRLYAAHRIVWIMIKGNIPAGYDIDHIDGVKFNNKIENLRLARRSENCQNYKNARINSRTGILGVSFNKQRGLYQASISVKKKYYREFFSDPVKAGEWYLQKKREIHPFSTI